MAPMLLLLAGAVPVLASEQTVPLRHATEVFRYGGPDAEEPYAFSQPPRLVVDSAENIYARVASEGTILVLGPDGRFVRRIGRKGEGPGEFQIAGAHGLIGDTLWVTNWPTPRMSLFRKDGSHLSTRRTWVASDRGQATHEGMWSLLRAGRAFVFVDPLVPVRTTEGS